MWTFFVLIWEYMLTVTLIKSIQLQLHWYLWGSDSHMYIYIPLTVQPFKSKWSATKWPCWATLTCMRTCSLALIYLTQRVLLYVKLVTDINASTSMGCKGCKGIILIIVIIIIFVTSAAIMHVLMLLDSCQSFCSYQNLSKRTVAVNPFEIGH